jgi:VanZ family protein
MIGFTKEELQKINYAVSNLLEVYAIMERIEEKTYAQETDTIDLFIEEVTDFSIYITKGFMDNTHKDADVVYAYASAVLNLCFMFAGLKNEQTEHELRTKLNKQVNKTINEN